MTDPKPIAPDAFEAAIEPLDGDEFASFVGEIRSRTADAVEVDFPLVRVRTSDDWTDVLVEPAATDAELRAADEFDAVAVATTDPSDVPGDTAVITPADLRQRLLYAMPAAEADALCDRFLDAPARSISYSDVDDATKSEPSEQSDSVEPGEQSDPGGRSGATDRYSATGRGDSGGAQSGTEQSLSGRSRKDEPVRPATRSPAEGESGTEAETGDGTGLDRSVGRFAMIGVLLLLLSTVAGAAYLTDGTVGDGASGLLGFGDDASVDPQERDDSLATNSNRTNVPDEDDGDGADGATSENETTVSTVESADEAARNTGLRPTCERSALQVVQIQMNAFRYNDNATNDGIRTARRFASPRNRRAVGPIGEFAELFETPQYAPMLSYDTVRYSVPNIGKDTATVQVVTRENGSVTGRYEFVLRKVPGGTETPPSGVDGEIDGCWMTNSVSASATD